MTSINLTMSSLDLEGDISSTIKHIFMDLTDIGISNPSDPINVLNLTNSDVQSSIVPSSTDQNWKERLMSKATSSIMDCRVHKFHETHLVQI